ncbi:hypothetical protein J5751_07040 [bacterium]|nr:hypothetical protein [bacterium]
MWQFIIYGILIVLYIVSYILEVKADISPFRQILVWIWIAFLVAIFVYPLVVFDGWWKLLFIISLVVIFGSMLFEGNKHADLDKKRHSSPL